DFDQILFDVHLLPNGYELEGATPSLGKRAVAKEMVNIFRTLTAQRFATSAMMFADQQQYYPVYVQDDCYYVVKERKVERIRQVKGAQECLENLYKTSKVKDLPPSRAITDKKSPIQMDLQSEAQ